MLTDLVEKKNDKLIAKASVYWPVHEPLQLQNCCVSLVDESKESNDLTVRTFSVRRDDTELRVHQIQYTGWPDQGSPDLADFGRLMTQYRKLRSALSPDDKIVVHCSAGIGRTGTFVAIDVLSPQWSVRDTVLELRKMRYGLVQTQV